MRMLAWIVAVMTVPSIASGTPPEVEAAYEKMQKMVESGEITRKQMEQRLAMSTN